MVTANGEYVLIQNKMSWTTLYLDELLRSTDDVQLSFLHCPCPDLSM